VLEAHIFDFEGDLYGEWVRIEWIERLRDIERFESQEQLKQQLQHDRARSLAVLRRLQTRVSPIPYS
jgi:riboflavin kinase/FMN adenylyltransferase